MKEGSTTTHKTYLIWRAVLFVAPLPLLLSLFSSFLFWPSQAGAAVRAVCSAPGTKAAIGGEPRLVGASSPHVLSAGGCSGVHLASMLPYIGQSPPLTFQGGYTVGDGLPGNITITPIFWRIPGSNTFGNPFKNGISRFLTDIAADSGKLSNPFSVLTQYRNAFTVHLAYSIKASPYLLVTDPVPYQGSGCTPDSGPVYNDGTGYTSCYTSTQLYQEVSNVVASRGLPADLSHVYPIFLPKGVEVCYTARNAAAGGTCSPTTPAHGSFCAYHQGGYFQNPNGSVTATLAIIEPWPVWSGQGGLTCGPTDSGAAQYPNHLPQVDIDASVLSHELAETITDPTGGGWITSTYYEVGDLCDGYAGSVHGIPGYGYNTVINGDYYYLQEEFSNAGYANNANNGCAANWIMPIASLTGPQTAKVGVGFRVSTTASVAPSGSIVNYALSLDGVPWKAGAGVRNPLVTFTSPGTHVIDLVVTDSGNYTAKARLSVQVSQ